MSTVKIKIKEIDSVVIRFAGDSGDGMQLAGEKFTDASAIAGNDISTFPDFPAEIRAPAGTLPGVSGFQIHFGSHEILTPGDAPDVLVAMNPAALKVNLKELVSKGMLVVNTDAFNEQNLKKAGYETNPLEEASLLEQYAVVKVDMTALTNKALEDSTLAPREKSRCKNFFALGLMFWVYNRPMEYTIDWIKSKFSKNQDLMDANIRTLKAGYHYGETTEIVPTTYKVERAKLKPGRYRKVSGNEALALGLVAAGECSKIEIVYGSYPITPASDILAEMAKHKNFGVKTIQAEDEIAAIGISIGASFAGGLGVTATSGPGFCLKSEALNFAVMTELPLVLIDVQRAGPSTGMPTKTEQGDLLQAMFGRNGESPVPILAAYSPADCFDTGLEAFRIALKYRTPVVLLSDCFIANSAEPWLIPSVNDLPDLSVPVAKPGENYIPYKRDPVTLSRQLAIPGTPSLEHRIGGLEKNEEGMVSYDPENHQKMVQLRHAKVAGIAKSYPPTEVLGSKRGKVLVLGWGGTQGAIKTAVENLQNQGESVSSIHLRHLNPLPLDLGGIIKNFKYILIPELNLGQLTLLIRAKYNVDAVCFSKVQGRPFTISEIISKIKEFI